MATLTKSAKVKNGDLRMIRFPKEGFFDGPFPKVRMDKELKNIFYGVGPCWFIVTEGSIPLLQLKGLHFRVINPVLKSELTTKQRIAIEKGEAILVIFDGVNFFFELPV